MHWLPVQVPKLHLRFRLSLDQNLTLAINQFNPDLNQSWTIVAYFSKVNCPGDINGDGAANASDWNLFIASYYNSTNPYTRGDDTGRYSSTADFNGDSVINQADYNYLDSIFRPPNNYWLTVPAYDNYNNQVTANVSIDSQIRRTTGNSFNVSSGYHILQVGVPSGYTWQNFTYNGNTNSNNPANVSVTSDLTITAHYNGPPPTYYQLTVYAEDQNWNPLTTMVYVDSQPVGYAGRTFNVTSGGHTLYVSTPSGCTFQNYTYNGNTVYQQTTTLTVTSNLSVVANFHEDAPPVWLTVSAGDNFGAAVTNADVNVDWYYVGQTGSTHVSVSQGNHTFHIGTPNGYALQYCICANNTYNDYSSIPIYADTTVLAYFVRSGQTPPACQVTVPVLDSNGNNIAAANVSIDGQVCRSGRRNL